MRAVFLRSSSPWLLALLTTATAGCVSNHQVSPFPPIESIHDILPPPDLDAHLQRIDNEAETNGFRLWVERRGALPDGDEIVVRGYETIDPFGRTLHLVRVASPVGVILALGPADAKEVDLPAFELVPSLIQGGWSSGTDLNGDGAPDIVVKDGAGVLSIWRIERYGASPLPIELLWPARSALDVNGDGHPDFASRYSLSIDDDPLEPRIVDIAIFDGGRYSNTSEEAIAWHRGERERKAAEVEEAIEAGEPISAMRAAIERCFHALRAGEEAKAALLELREAREKAKKLGALPVEVQEAFAGWEEFLTQLGDAAPLRADRSPSR